MHKGVRAEDLKPGVSPTQRALARGGVGGAAGVGVPELERFVPEGIGIGVRPLGFLPLTKIPT